MDCSDQALFERMNLINTQKKRTILALSIILIVAGGICPRLAATSTSRGNGILIVWPTNNASFGVGTIVKIKADVTEPESSILRVQFFAGTNLLGTVTNAPFNIIWQVDHNPASHWSAGFWDLKTVVEDKSGAINESAIVHVGFSLDPQIPVVPISTPTNGTMLPEGVHFLFGAEVLASAGDSGPVEFFLGTNSLGILQQEGPLSATNLPFSVVVSNLVEGQYDLSVRFRGLNDLFCSCQRITNIIRIVRLGIRSAILADDGSLQFEVVTSFPGTQTIIQSSTNLLNWTSISTNIPTGNFFNLTNTTAFAGVHWFRASIAPN